MSASFLTNEHQNVIAFSIVSQMAQRQIEITASALKVITEAQPRETRCIIYSSSFDFVHKFVKVECEGIVAFALVRPQLLGFEHTISWGLLCAFKKKDQQREGKGFHFILYEEEEHNNSENIQAGNSRIRKKGCNCTLRSLVKLKIYFLTNTQPIRAYMEIIKKSISRLLIDEVVWDQMITIVNWRNSDEIIQFTELETIDKEGTGCCSFLAKITNGTQFEFNTSLHLEEINFDPTQLINQHEVLVEKITKDLGGVRRYTNELVSAISHRLNWKRASGSFLAPPVGALVHGLPGVGKTSLIRSLSESLGMHVVHLNGPDIFKVHVGDSEKELVKIFSETMRQEPCLLVVDSIEALVTSRASLMETQNSLQVALLGTFLSCLDNIKLQSKRVFIIGITSRIEDIDTAVYTNGRMDMVLHMEPPTKSHRLRILEKITSSWKIESHLTCIEKMSESTGGFVSADIVSLCQKALLEASKDNTSHCSPVITQTHFESALSISYPSTLQSLHVSKRGKDSMSKSSTSISFATLHGLEEAIELLRVSLIEPLEDCTRFLKFGTVPPKGILLVGPPGSGKSHLAHAVAKVVQEQGIASFVSVQCTDLITKVVGDTEKALRELFETARSAAPCVLYFDQIESIAPVRGFDSSTEQTFDRILSMLLVEMDGFDTSGRNFYNKELSDETKNAFLQQHIVILASTHEKKMLDPAILRPGRFDIHIQLEFPNLEARKRIILDLLKQIPVNFSTSKEWFEGESHEAFAEFLASKTDGVAAGDLHSIMREAAISTMRENIESTAVKIVHIMKALEECRFLKI